MKNFFTVCTLSLFVFLFIPPVSANVDSSAEKSRAFMNVLNENFISDDEINSVGGLWFDEDGTPHLQIKKNRQATLSVGLQNLLSNYSGSSVVIEEVNYSTDELSDIIQSLSENRESFGLPENYMISRDDPTNGIKIVSSKSLKQETKEKIEDAYGSGLFVYENKNLPIFSQEIGDDDEDGSISNNYVAPFSPFGRLNDNSYLGGGLGIKASGQGSCSTAGVAYKNGAAHVITAAHCFKGSSSDLLWRQWHAPLGRATVGLGMPRLDVGLIKIEQTGGLANGRWATNRLVGPMDRELRISDVRAPRKGLFVNRSGITSFNTSGRITEVNASVVTNNGPKDHAFIMETDSVATNTKPGDSGGAVYSNNVLYGVITATDNRYQSVGTDLHAAARNLGFSIHTSNAGKKIR